MNYSYTNLVFFTEIKENKKTKAKPQTKQENYEMCLSNTFAFANKDFEILFQKTSLFKVQLNQANQESAPLLATPWLHLHTTY